MSQYAYRLLGLFLTALPMALSAEEGNETLPPRDQGLYQTLIMVGIALAFFYMILWRPEQKRRKELEQKRSKLSKGDKVNAVGIVGTIYKVQEHTVILKTADDTKIEVLKAAINEVEPPVDDAKSS